MNFQIVDQDGNIIDLTAQGVQFVNEGSDGIKISIPQSLLPDGGSVTATLSLSDKIDGQMTTSSVTYDVPVSQRLHDEIIVALGTQNHFRLSEISQLMGGSDQPTQFPSQIHVNGRDYNVAYVMINDRSMVAFVIGLDFYYEYTLGDLIEPSIDDFFAANGQQPSDFDQMVEDILPGATRGSQTRQYAMNLLADPSTGDLAADFAIGTPTTPVQEGFVNVPYRDQHTGIIFDAHPSTLSQ